MITRTPLVEYDSLAALYRIYRELFLDQSPIRSACGCEVHCYEHHLVHCVKLFDANGGRLYFPDVREKIIQQEDGFGEFTHEDRRGRRLRGFQETIISPDAVVRPRHLKTADRAYIKEFDCSQYPYLVALVRKEGDLLTLCTLEPVRRGGGKKWFDGEILYPKTPQPSE